ncbi:MAG: uroporphyrinogen-III C-methyltransferase [bacterium]
MNIIKRKVYLIGAGPGKHDLITVRGKRIIEQAEVIIYDYLVDKELLAYARQDAELICCGKLAHKGKYSYGHPVEQEVIDRIILKKAAENKKVVRLKNGDPAFFSRFSEELKMLLNADIEFEVVPGITAAGAASCLSGIPLTDRDLASSCVFAAGHESASKERNNNGEILSQSGTLVIYMGVGNLKKIIKKVIETGKSAETPVAIIKDISLISQQLIRGTLDDIVRKAEEAHLTPPAIIIIGEVAGMNRKYNWSERNKRILFTGLSQERYFLEGTYVHLPMIRIEPLADYTEFDEHVKHIRDFDWIVFTSRVGVEYFFKRFNYLGFDARHLHNIKIAVIGQSTRQELNQHGLMPDVIPQDESSKGLVDALKDNDIKGSKIFIPRSNLSDKGMEKACTDLSAEVIASLAYNNVMPPDLPDLNLKEFNEILFTSPSTVRNFKRRYGTIPDDISVACIGDVTKAAFIDEFKKEKVLR